ncbi:MAG: hypothetical protein BMS9Abin26_1834 [Gammaproteobacteria bacterium]|nr:MAG: hypothetical protein BMS9Abin26_1834 [Gammaproteobacteria bacterium]
MKTLITAISASVLALGLSMNVSADELDDLLLHGDEDLSIVKLGNEVDQNRVNYTEVDIAAFEVSDDIEDSIYADDDMSIVNVGR